MGLVEHEVEKRHSFTILGPPAPPTLTALLIGKVPHQKKNWEGAVVMALQNATK